MPEPQPPDVVFTGAIPILASTDIDRWVAFYVERLGFTALMRQAGAYAVVVRDAVSLHARAWDDPALPPQLHCRLRVSGVAALHAHCAALGLVDPASPLADQPWGSREFGIVDPDGNHVTFTEPLDT